MAKQTDLFLTAAIKTAGVAIAPADTTAWKTVYTASANDAIVKGLACVSDDTAAKAIRIGIDIAGGGTVYQIATVAIPIASGTTGSANAIDLLQAAALPFLPVDRNGKRVLPLRAGDILKVSALATLTTAKTITVTAIAEEY